MTACVHKVDTASRAVDEACASEGPSFAKDIQPILRVSCAKSGCHDGQSMPHDFSDYRELQLIIPDSTFYYFVIKDRSMPQDTPLSEHALQILRCWAAQQYPNN